MIGHKPDFSSPSTTLRIWTIGHSTRTIEEFISLLSSHGVRSLADVRQYAGSRRYPQFNHSNLADALHLHEIKYIHIPELGGRRSPRSDSTNTGLRNEAFCGFADYMETTEFHAAIEALMSIATESPTAMMCAEKDWKRCHRSLISDYLTLLGTSTSHIVDSEITELHRLSPSATIIEGRLSYPQERDLFQK